MLLQGGRKRNSKWSWASDRVREAQESTRALNITSRALESSKTLQKKIVDEANLAEVALQKAEKLCDDIKDDLQTEALNLRATDVHAEIQVRAAEEMAAQMSLDCEEAETKCLEFACKLDKAEAELAEVQAEVTRAQDLAAENQAVQDLEDEIQHLALKLEVMNGRCEGKICIIGLNGETTIEDRLKPEVDEKGAQTSPLPYQEQATQYSPRADSDVAPSLFQQKALHTLAFRPFSHLGEDGLPGREGPPRATYDRAFIVRNPTLGQLALNAARPKVTWATQRLVSLERRPRPASAPLGTPAGFGLGTLDNSLRPSTAQGTRRPLSGGHHGRLGAPDNRLRPSSAPVQWTRRPASGGHHGRRQNRPPTATHSEPYLPRPALVYVARSPCSSDDHEKKNGNRPLRVRVVGHQPSSLYDTLQG